MAGGLGRREKDGCGHDCYYVLPGAGSFVSLCVLTCDCLDLYLESFYYWPVMGISK